MKQVKVKSKTFFYFLLALVLLRPSLDILSQWEFQLHSSLPYFNINLMLGGLVFLAALFYLMPKFKQVWSFPLFFPIKIFLGLAFVSIFYSIDKFGSSQEFVRLATIFLLYFLAYQLIEHKKDFFLLLKVILASYILPAFFALIQFVFGLGLADDFGGFQRIYGTFAHPNPFAFYTIFVLALVIALALSKKLLSQPNNLWLWAGAGLLAFLVLATYSRSALFALLLFLLFFGIFKYRKLLLAGLAIFAIGYLFFPAFQERLWELITLDPYGSVVWRFRLWKDVLPIALWQPLFGQGLGCFEKITEFYRGLKFGSLEAHNDYLKILVENGIIGLLAYLSIIIGLLISLWKRFRKAVPQYKSLALGIFVVVLSLYSVSMFDNVLRATALQWNLWILLGAWLKLKRL